MASTKDWCFRTSSSAVASSAPWLSRAATWPTQMPTTAAIAADATTAMMPIEAVRVRTESRSALVAMTSSASIPTAAVRPAIATPRQR